MFKIGDYIVHGRNGVCKVVDITHIDISGADKNQLYYTLVPMKSADSKICIIKTLYARNQERISQGKRITYVDDRYLKEAKQNLNDEFSIALGIKPTEVEKYIEEHIKK